MHDQDQVIETTPNTISVANLPSLQAQVTRQPHATIAITVYFVDSLGQSLHPAIILRGAYQAPLRLPQPQIAGYLLYDITHFQREFLPNSDGIILIYTKQLAAPIIAYHEDELGRSLQEPVYYRGDIGREFHLMPLADYQAELIQVQGTVNGRFSEQVQQVYFRYQCHAEQQPFNWHHNAVKLRVAKQAYEAPDKATQLDWKLPVESTWQIFKTVKQAATHQIWFNLGGDLWITSLNAQLVNVIDPEMTLVTSDDATPTAITKIQQALDFAVIANDQTTLQAEIIASPYFPISQWTRPYGQIVAQRLPNQTIVVIESQLTLENGSQWCRLEHGYYVESKYLKILSD